MLMLLAQRPHFEEQVALRALSMSPYLLSTIMLILGVNVYKGTLRKQRCLPNRMFVLAVCPFWVSSPLGDVNGFCWKCYVASWLAQWNWGPNQATRIPEDSSFNLDSKLDQAVT